MVHPATQRVVRAAIVALNAPLDIGMVFQPKPGEDRGYGVWTNRDLNADDILAMLPRLAAANSRGGAIFMRLGPSSRQAHPGIVMLDDLAASAVQQLSLDGFEPCLTVETSLGNFQAWIRLIAEGTVDYGVVTQVVRHLAQACGGDERAVSPRQPGRVAGFTNRKPKHQMADGKFPFVQLTEARPGRVASHGGQLIHRVSGFVTGRAARGALPETPRDAAVSFTRSEPEIIRQLEATHQAQRSRIFREVAEGRRPPDAASNSEIDFAVAKAALAAGLDRHLVANWLTMRRPEKAPDYAERTLEAAISRRDRDRPPELRKVTRALIQTTTARPGLRIAFLLQRRCILGEPVYFAASEIGWGRVGMARGRPLLGEKPLSSTERSRRTRRREAARVRALELFAGHIRREVGIQGITSHNLTESQKELAFVAYGMSKWLDARLVNLDDAADFFNLDANGYPLEKD